MKSDEFLINDFLNGDLKGFETLFKRHRSSLYRYILKIIKDKELADDFCQDTWLKVFNSIKSGKYNEQGKFINWVKFLAKNLIGDYFRKVKKYPTISVSYYGYSIENQFSYDLFDNAIERQEDLNIISELVNNLNHDQNKVILAVIFNDQSFKEFSQDNKLSINTALGRKRYAIKNLRKMYDQRHAVCI